MCLSYEDLCTLAIHPLQAWVTKLSDKGHFSHQDSNNTNVWNIQSKWPNFQTAYVRPWHSVYHCLGLKNPTD